MAQGRVHIDTILLNLLCHVLFDLRAKMLLDLLLLKLHKWNNNCFEYNARNLRRSGDATLL